MQLKFALIGALALSLALIPLTSMAGGKKKGKRLALNLIGTGTAYTGTVPDIDGDGIDDEAMCFDVQLFDLKKNKQIGTATDCLADVTPVGDGLNLIGTSYFNFDNGAQLVTRGQTTVQPSTGDLGGFTHITGAAATGDDVLGGTKKYKKASGAVRLSGMVDMSALDSAGQITFD